MKIGVPKEIKVHEYRVGLVPAGVRELVDAGHQVLVQSGAGAGIGFEDAHYQAAGAKIAAAAAEVFVRGRISSSRSRNRSSPNARSCAPDQILFTYLHLAADREQAEALMASGATAIAYETVTGAGRVPAAAHADERGRRPHVGAGGRQLPAEGQRRLRRTAGRRARRAAGQGRDPGRRRLGHPRRRDGGRPARRRHRGGPLGQAPARAVRRYSAAS